MARKKVGGTDKSKKRGENVKDNSNSGGSGRVLRSRSATKGGGNADEKPKGRKPMVKKDNLTINDDGAQKGEHSGKRKVKTEEEKAEVAKTPAKRSRSSGENEKGKGILSGSGSVKRRNADKAIAESYMPSAEKGSYNLRERKSVPSFQRVELSESGFAEIVGKRVKLYRSGSRKWVTGQIKSYDAKKKLHKILYVDGELENLDLKTQRFEVEVMPGEASTLSLKNKANAGEPTGKVVRKAAIEGESKLQKRRAVAEKVKGRKSKMAVSSRGSDDLTVDTEEGDEETDSDGDMVISEIANVTQKKKLPKLREKMAINVGKKRGYGSHKTEDDGDEGGTSLAVQKRGNAENKAGKAASKKTVSTEVSASKTKPIRKTKMDEGPLNVEKRKNPARKARPNA